MKSRAVLVASPIVLAVLIVAWVVTQPDASPAQQPAATAVTVPVDVDTTRLPGPVQPVFYRHDVHVTDYEMDCRYCHFAVEISTSAGMPTVSTCMGCHLVAGAANPEVRKVREAWSERRPIEWVEIHRLSQFVRFPHNRHVTSNEGVFEGMEITETCVECHGPIPEMPQVYQFASLKMGWCVTCHEKSEVTTDCTACHY